LPSHATTQRRFRTPLNGNGVFWYSFSVGNVHVAMISSEHDPSPDSPMGQWLEDDLLGVDRAATPWLVVANHRPLVMTQDYAPEIKMSHGTYAILEPLLLKARVDVFMAGHIHSMQRSCAMANFSCVLPGEHGVVHYMNGAAGHSLMNNAAKPSTYIEKTILKHHGYSIVDAVNSTHMRLQFYGPFVGSCLARAGATDSLLTRLRRPQPTQITA
jgi:acid phosphatase type 7